MPLVSLSPDPILQFFGNDGTPLVGGKLFTYQAGTNNAAPTYTDSSGSTQHQNPIILNSRGEVAYNTGQSAGLWIPGATYYKFVLQDANGNGIWSLDNISDGSAGILALLTSNFIAQILDSMKLTTGEQANSVTPTDYSYPPGDVRRYGAVNGENAYSAFSQALSANAVIMAGPGETYLMEQQLAIGSGKTILLNGATIKRNFDSTLNPTLGTLTLNNSNTVRIENGILDGNRDNTTASEFKHNIEILGCNNVVLEDIISQNTMGDGVYIGYNIAASTYSTNITLRSVTTDNAYRNGLSITGADGVDCVSCEFSNTSGTAPNSGVDIEGNSTSDVTRNIHFLGCRANNNFADGFNVSFVFGFDTDKQRNVSFHGCDAVGNGDVGFHAYRTNTVSFHGGAARENGGDGARVSAAANGLEFIGVDLSLNGRRGLFLSPEGGASAANIVVSASTIMNNSRSSNGTYEGIRAEGLGNVVGLTVVYSAINENHSFAVSTTANSSLVRIIGNSLINNAVGALNLSDELATRRLDDNIGYVNKSWGNNSVSDGGTIDHGLADTPSAAVVSASVARQFASVTARSSTTITVAIKKDDGSAGDTQTIYYMTSL